MTGITTTKPPVWYWVVAAIALVWNIFGVIAYLGSVYATEESTALMTPEQIALMEATPGWVTGAFAIAVFGGAIGCLLLLLKKKLAIPFLGASLGAVIVQNLYAFTQTNSTEVYGTVQGVVMPLVVIVVAILLVMLARSARSKGWIS